MPKPCPFCNAPALPVERITRIDHTGCSNSDCILGGSLYPLAKWDARVLDKKDVNFAISQQVAGMIDAAYARCPVSGYAIRNEQAREDLIVYAKLRAQDIDHGETIVNTISKSEDTPVP